MENQNMDNSVLPKNSGTDEDEIFEEPAPKNDTKPN
jgi:hypothetical protein